MAKVFLILSCARSGSTSLARVLDTAANGMCVVEPAPNLNCETREMMEGRLANPRDVLESTVVARARQNLESCEVYGEKNLTYGPFIPLLHEMLGCRLVFLRRDGRDVVRSLINWHEQKFGTVYRECRDPGRLSYQAVQAAARLPVHLDTSDYSRPRPRKDDPLYPDWEALSRAEMCAYCWATVNKLYVDELGRLPEDCWTEIDYTAVSADDVFRVADFCGLKGLSRAKVDQMLQARINSLADRGAEEGAYPDWRDWDGGRRRCFDRIAADTMRLLGYYQEPGSEWRPPGYGEVRRTQPDGLAWYESMYEGRRKMHQDLVAWVRQRDGAGDTIESIADFGCGLGVGYCDDFADKRYVGIDVSEANIRWCREKRANSRHEYYCRDFVHGPLAEPVDLVFSSGTIDNVYDVDKCLRSMVRSARKWIHATFYRGWFPDLTEHKYSWNDEHKCFYNDVSPMRIKDTLLNLGCRDVRVGPVRTGRSDIPFETLVIARVPERR